jgi:hypothetical protein
MSGAAFSEPENLRKACQTIIEQLQASGPWLSPEGQPLIDLANSLKAYYAQTRRMFRLTKSRDNCQAAITACDRMNPEVRKSVLAGLQQIEKMSGAKLDEVLGLMEPTAQAADAVNRLTNDSPLRQRVSAMRSLEDACMRILDALNAQEEDIPTAATADDPAAAKPAEVLSPPKGGPHDSKDGSAVGITVDGKPIPRLSVAKLREFLDGVQPPPAANSLAAWLERGPDDTLPNSWIMPAACPISGTDVLVAFGKSRKEIILSKEGHLLKFNPDGVLVPA